MRIDLNADVGESFGAWSIGEHEVLAPFGTSFNIAAGMHAGGPVILERTVELAARHGISIGAHRDAFEEALAHLDEAAAWDDLWRGAGG